MSDQNPMSEPEAVQAVREPSIVQRAVAEAIGTFFLVLTIITAVASGSVLAPLAIGAALMVMVFAVAHISGAHVNPAVTLAVFLRGRISAAEVGPYIGGQLVGAVVASLLGLWMVSDKLSSAPAALSGKAIFVALLAEFLFTFALCFVVLNVATATLQANNQFYGLAIGFIVLAGAVAVGSLSGGAFNPAVAVGISIAKLTSWANIWIYLVAELAGGALAALAFRFLHPDDL